MCSAVAQVLQQVQDAEADRHVEHRDRLVGEQHLGVGGERPGDRHALALAARELVGELVDVALGGVQLHAVEQLDERVLELAAAQAPLVDADAARERVAHGVHGVQRAERVLEDHLHAADVAAERATALASRRPRRAAGCARRSSGISWASRRAIVDLPEPDSPTRASTRPRCSSKFTSSTACTTPREPTPRSLKCLRRSTACRRRGRCRCGSSASPGRSVGKRSWSPCGVHEWAARRESRPPRVGVSLRRRLLRWGSASTG